MSSGTTVQWDKCPSGTNVPVGQMSSGTNVRGTNVQWDSCPVGLMSCGTIVSGTVVTPPLFLLWLKAGQTNCVHRIVKIRTEKVQLDLACLQISSWESFFKTFEKLDFEHYLWKFRTYLLEPILSPFCFSKLASDMGTFVAFIQNLPTNYYSLFIYFKRPLFKNPDLPLQFLWVPWRS